MLPQGQSSLSEGLETKGKDGSTRSMCINPGVGRKQLSRIEEQERGQCNRSTGQDKGGCVTALQWGQLDKQKVRADSGCCCEVGTMQGGLSTAWARQCGCQALRPH